MSHPSGDCDEEYIIVNIFKINIDNDYKNNMTGIGMYLELFTVSMTRRIARPTQMIDRRRKIGFGKHFCKDPRIIFD